MLVSSGPSEPIADAGFESSLVLLLMSLWSWGHISPQLCQQIATKFDTKMNRLNAYHSKEFGIPLDQFDNLPEVSKLAGIGINGQHPLRKLLPTTPFKLAIGATMLPLRMLNALLNSFRMVSHAIFWPHIVVASLFKRYKES